MTAHPSEEPIVSWPTWRIVGTVSLVAAVCAAAWAAAPWFGADSAAATAGVSGALLVAAIALFTLLLMQPWKARRVSTWMNFWIGGSVLRLLVTPLLTYLIYFAASLSAVSLALSVGLTYVLTLLAEAAVLALHMRRFA
jgi:hypothetical protein